MERWFFDYVRRLPEYSCALLPFRAVSLSSQSLTTLNRKTHTD